MDPAPDLHRPNLDLRSWHLLLPPTLTESGDAKPSRRQPEPTATAMVGAGQPVAPMPRFQTNKLETHRGRQRTQVRTSLPTTATQNPTTVESPYDGIPTLRQEIPRSAAAPTLILSQTKNSHIMERPQSHATKTRQWHSQGLALAASPYPSWFACSARRFLPPVVSSGAGALWRS
jgi:hypothetical protein